MQVTTNVSDRLAPVHIHRPWADIFVPLNAEALVVMAYDSRGGEDPMNGRLRARGQAQPIAHALHEALLGTFAIDFCDAPERSLSWRALRLAEDVRWLRRQPLSSGLGVGLLGIGNAAAVALRAAAEEADPSSAVVAWGSRPDAAGSALVEIVQPTLLLTGAEDLDGMTFGRAVFDRLTCDKKQLNVLGASHLFDEPGTFEMAIALVCDWFRVHLTAATQPGPSGIGFVP